MDLRCRPKLSGQCIYQSVDAHCETVAVSTAGYYETLLSHTTRHTQAEKEKFPSDAQHQFFNVLSSSNIREQVKLLRNYEVRRLQAALNAGAGWESPLYQEVMWQHHLAPLLHENDTLNGVVLGCGAEIQKSFLFGTSTFGEILCKVCAYAAKNQNFVKLPCYPMMYVFDNDELTQSDLNKKSKIHSACIQWQLVATVWHCLSTARIKRYMLSMETGRLSPVLSLYRKL